MFKVQKVEALEPTYLDINGKVVRCASPGNGEQVPPKPRMEFDPHGKSPHEMGSKLDAGKCMAGVLSDFSYALNAVALIGTHGAEKYTRGGWQEVPEAQVRYFDAFWRHLLASRHEEMDKDSGLPHLAACAWNLLAILELQAREAK